MHTYEYYYTVNTYIRYDIPYTYKIEDYNRLIYEYTRIILINMGIQDAVTPRAPFALNYFDKSLYYIYL